jgi:hypothetical protein
MEEHPFSGNETSIDGSIRPRKSRSVSDLSSAPAALRGDSFILPQRRSAAREKALYFARGQGYGTGRVPQYIVPVQFTKPIHWVCSTLATIGIDGIAGRNSGRDDRRNHHLEQRRQPIFRPALRDAVFAGTATSS